MLKKILVIAAHPDDEVLGCGATIARHVNHGDEVHVVILAEGITSRDRHRNRNMNTGKLAELSDAAHRAHQILGSSSFALRDFPDNRMDSVDRLEIVKAVEEIIAQYRPDVVYSHHIGDVNIDHRRIHEAVVTACRPIPGNHPVKQLLFFEVCSSTEWQLTGSAPPFVPNWFVDVSDTLDKKLEALSAYASEMRAWPHARSIQAVGHLARWRGAAIGAEAAEAFILGRSIES